MTVDWTAPPRTDGPEGVTLKPEWKVLDESDEGRGHTIWAVYPTAFRGNARRIASNLERDDAELITRLYEEAK